MTENIKLSRNKSLRAAASNVLKPPPVSHQQLHAALGPSNIDLFLTNLRLLDLDLRDDWPDITALTFSSKDGQQNLKKRIHCVEWALYQLFSIWDPEETKDKLQPFFPPIEHLQSLNLRAALLRCLEQAKKNGILGRDAVLRKTMLDECKGERLEEVLAVFSTAVLKNVVRKNGGRGQKAIAEQLTMENFSYTGERMPLITLIQAHKSSLTKRLAEKNAAKARYNDFSGLLDLKERQITRRSEQLKVSIEEGSMNAISDDHIQALRDTVDKNWSSSTEWLETVLHGRDLSEKDALLAHSFDDVWKHVENGTVGEVEYSEREGLLEQLNARVRKQSSRLEKWQDFEKELSKVVGDKTKKAQSSEHRKKNPATNLDFGVHEKLQLNFGLTKITGNKSRAPLDEYARLIENLHTDLSNVGKERKPEPVFDRQRSPFKLESKPINLSTMDEMEAALRPNQIPPIGSDAETEEPTSKADKSVLQPITQKQPSELAMEDADAISSSELSRLAAEQEANKINLPAPAASRSVSTVSAMPPPSPPSPPSPSSPPSPTSRTSSPLASKILASVLGTSPSPTKPRHVLSLAERTRLSMAHVSMTKSDLYPGDLDDNDNDDDIPDHDAISQAPKSRRGLRVSTTQDLPTPPKLFTTNTTAQHDDLLARTRQSMSNFSTVQKAAQVERRRSIKVDARKKRESFRPKPLEPTHEQHDDDDNTGDDALDRKKLIESGGLDVDYEVVFKSRPRIKTSPERSPERSPVKAWGDMGGVAEGSSPLSE